LFQLGKGGRRKKDLQGLGEALTHLTRTLQLDLQEHGGPRFQTLDHWLTRGSVAISCEFSPLQQTPVADQMVK
jgi:hypothetical protein